MALPIAATLVNQDVFLALVEGFAALGAVITSFSGFLAFFALANGDSLADIGEAVNYGIAYGFMPGMAVAAAVFLSAATTL